jgi:hypothetical protein
MEGFPAYFAALLHGQINRSGRVPGPDASAGQQGSQAGRDLIST